MHFGLFHKSGEKKPNQHSCSRERCRSSSYCFGCAHLWYDFFLPFCTSEIFLKTSVKKSNTHPLTFFMAPSKTNTIRKCWQRRDPPTTNLLINIINSICRKRKKRTSQEKEDQKLPLLQGISSLQLPDWEITTISQIRDFWSEPPWSRCGEELVKYLPC